MRVGKLRVDNRGRVRFSVQDTSDYHYRIEVTKVGIKVYQRYGRNEEHTQHVLPTDLLTSELVEKINQANYLVSLHG